MGKFTRSLVTFGATVLCSLGAAQAQTQSLQDMSGDLANRVGPATIYVARDFLTMDPKRPRAEAVAVRNGKFIAVGSLADVTAAAGPGARVSRDLATRTVTPGFVEQHVHPVLAALTMSMNVLSIEDWDTINGFSGAIRDEAAYEKRLRAALAAHKDKSKVFATWGYHHYFHGEMTRVKLDKLSPTTPIIVWHRSGHEFYLNTAALKLAGIDQALVDAMPAAAKAQADFGKGHFYEQAALAIMGKLAPMIATPAIFKRGLEYTERYYHQQGITLACEPGGFASKPMQDAINAVYSDEATPFNHCFIADGKTFVARNPADAPAVIRDTEQVLSWGKGRAWYLPKQVKLFTDGAIFSQLMMMKDGYTDGHKGAWIMDPPVFANAFQMYWDAGFQVHIHNNGDAGIEVLLGELEKAMARNPRKDHRTVLIHFGFAQPQQVKRWIELGGIVSSNPYYVTALAGRYAKLGIGPERSANMVPHGDVLGNNGSLSFHSDMPMAPAKPLQLVWAAVTRKTFEGPVAGPQHRVTVEQALRSITIDAAYSIQQERRVGSIEIGKDANLTILNSNPLTTEAEKLKDITVWGTMLEGRMQPVRRAGSNARTAAALPLIREAVGALPAELSGQPVAAPPSGLATIASRESRLAYSRRMNDLGLCKGHGDIAALILAGLSEQDEVTGGR